MQFPVELKIAAAIGVVVGAYLFGCYNTQVKADREALKLQNKSLTVLNERKDKINELEKQLAAANQQAAAAYEKGRQSAQDEADDTIANYRSGNIKLRKQLQCTVNLVRSVPDASTAGQFTEQARNCGLSSADVEFLIRFAAETNRLRDKVNALIDQAQSDREIINKAAK